LAAKRATQTIPIVIPFAIDPVGAGLAESLPRPGGNVTGLSVLSPELGGKGLSLLKEAVPGLSRVAVLWNAGNPAFAPVWRALDAAAHSLEVALLSQPVRESQDFAVAFAAIPNQRPDGFLLLFDACRPTPAANRRVYAAGTPAGSVQLSGFRRPGRLDVVRAESPPAPYHLSVRFSVDST
jgi:ABC-type uncharacterized transport system substrate-binding protein